MKTQPKAPTKSQDQQLDEAYIADFCLARIGGVASQSLHQFILHQTMPLVARILHLEDVMHEASLPVEEFLYSLVPQIGNDKQMRRRILSMKRNIHNARLWDEAEEDITSISLALDVKSREKLHVWYQLALEREKILQDATALYEQELGVVSYNLFSSLQDQQFLQGLALASQDVTRSLIQFHSSFQRSAWRPSSKLARTSFAYLTRAAIKTSPFSTFTQLDTAEFKPITNHTYNDNSQTLVAQEKRNVVCLTHSIPFTLLMDIARDAELATLLEFEPNQGISYSEEDKTHAYVLTSSYVYFGQFAGRNERLVKRRFDQNITTPLITFLKSHSSIPYLELLNLLNSTGQFRNLHKTVLQLLDMQLIKPIIPYKKLEAQPVLVMASIMEQLPGLRAQKLASLMREVNSYCEKIGSADAVARLDYLTQLRQKVILVFEQLGTTPPEWLQHVSLIYEDVRFDCAPISLPQEIQNDLSQFARFLRPHIVRTKTYDFLYHFFVKKFGINGEANDIQSFLQQFLEQDDAGELMLRAMAEDSFAMHNTEEGRSYLPSGLSATPPACTVFFQIAAESEEALAKGKYKLIINQVNSGQGGLLSRFNRLLHSPSDNLTERLQHWLSSLHRQKQILEMPVVGDWNNLQSAQGLSSQVLQWPAELSTIDKENTLPLRNLRLRANSADATLYLVDDKGQIITPSYLGIVPSHFSPYILHIFLQLLDPWTNGWMSKSFDTNEKKPEGIKFTPRQEIGRVVLQRASWYIPLSLLPQRSKDEEDFAFFVRIQKWRRDYHIPEEVFAARGEDRASFDHKKRKPIWVQFGSPHALELLYQFIDKETASIILTEVLPAPTQHWLVKHDISTIPAHPVTDRADQRVGNYASEYMVLMHWPMPAQPPSPSAQDSRMPDRTRNEEKNWLYFKIYSPGPEMLDTIIRSIVAPILEQTHRKSLVRCWFYIRFYDEHGWHIRLRLQIPSSFSQQLTIELQAFIQEAVSQLPSFSLPQQYKQTNSNSASDLPLVSIHTYEPENEKYGGSVGVALSEHLFELSSNLMLKLLTLEDVKSIDKIYIAFTIMNLLIQEVYDTVQEQLIFLKYYFWYWTNQNRDGSEEARNDIKSDAAQNRLVFLQNSEAIRDTESIRQLLKTYISVFTDMLHLWTTTIALHEYSVRQLCFDHIHLNNNRLGILTSEEGYLAALLLAIWDTEHEN